MCEEHLFIRQTLSPNIRKLILRNLKTAYLIFNSNNTEKFVRVNFSFENFILFEDGRGQ